MRRVHGIELLLFLIGSIFSLWLFGKSLGYDARADQLWVARNQVGDFGLHLALVRSVGWGDNIPLQSPFYSGIALPYHYLFDALAGLISRVGVRTDLAINGLSALFFVLLLSVLYLLPQVIFGGNMRLGLLSLLLFLSPGGWAFVDFFRSNPAASWLSRWWRLPDYLHSGPFDGSVYATYFTLNVFLNQRHLVAALAVSVLSIIILLRGHERGTRLSAKTLLVVIAGIGITCWLHTVIGIATLLVAWCMCWKSRSIHDFIRITAGVVGIMLPRLSSVSVLPAHHVFWNPGFLAVRPITPGSWLQYWWHNMGVMVLLIPAGAVLAPRGTRTLFWSGCILFAVGNLIQLSYRIEHNHTLMTFSFILFGVYGAHALDRLWRYSGFGKVVAIGTAVIIGLNLFMELPAVKNDYHYVVLDTPSTRLMQWIAAETPKRSIFITPGPLMDPVTLAGRFTYVGPSYYLDVMGYDPAPRRILVSSALQSPSLEHLQRLQDDGVSYIVIPHNASPAYPYPVNAEYFDFQLETVFADAAYTVYSL